MCCLSPLSARFYSSGGWTGRDTWRHRERERVSACPDFHRPETENSNRPPDVDTRAQQGPPCAPWWQAAAQLMSPSPFMLADGKWAELEKYILARQNIWLHVCAVGGGDDKAAIVVLGSINEKLKVSSFQDWRQKHAHMQVSAIRPFLCTYSFH